MSPDEEENLLPDFSFPDHKLPGSCHSVHQKFVDFHQRCRVGAQEHRHLLEEDRVQLPCDVVLQEGREAREHRLLIHAMLMLPEGVEVLVHANARVLGHFADAQEGRHHVALRVELGSRQVEVLQNAHNLAEDVHVEEDPNKRIGQCPRDLQCRLRSPLPPKSCNNGARPQLSLQVHQPPVFQIVHVDTRKPDPDMGFAVMVVQGMPCNHHCCACDDVRPEYKGAEEVEDAD
eukprot:840861-Rhodomonas_salina.2